MVTREQAMAAKVGDEFHHESHLGCLALGTFSAVRVAHMKFQRVILKRHDDGLQWLEWAISESTQDEWHRAEDCPRKEQA